MTPDGMGRYCNACAVTVVDFSVMSDEAVQQYFISHHEQKICGRFKNTQLQRIVIELPKNIFRLQIPFWKKFLVAFLICFGGSFLSIDIAMAGQSFTQGSPITKIDGNFRKIIVEKKKKRSARKKKKKKLDYQKDFTMVVGNTWGGPSSAPPEAFPFDTTVHNLSKENTDSGINAKNNSSSNNPVKDPAPTIPYSGSAFMLPAISRARNPFSKKKKVQYV